MTEAEFSRRDRIRALNDQFRTTFIGGRVLVTAGVRELPLDVNARVLRAVQSFADFSGNNDPYGEHDFGAVQVEGETYFFKIDLYDRDCRYGSEEPADPDQTTRVLTIMRADEY